MNCLNEGQIQAYIDGELDGEEKKEVETHILLCENCRQNYNELKTLNGFVLEKMQNYKIHHLNTEVNNKEFYHIMEKRRKGVFNNMNKYKKIAVAACAAVALTTCITVKPIRAAISEVVSIFRINEIKSINISLDDVNKLKDALQKRQGNIQIDSIGKVTMEGGQGEAVRMDEAEKKLPFAAEIPEGVHPNNVFITEPKKIDFTMNVDNINQIIKNLGGKKLFPPQLNRKTFTIKIPTILSYDFNFKGKNIYVEKTKIPEITGPSDVNVDEIVDALSELSILPYDVQKQLKSMKDIRNTLYIPNINNKIEELNIDGLKVFGYFEKGKNEPSSDVIFLKDGIITRVSGDVDKNEIIEIVKSMR